MYRYICEKNLSTATYYDGKYITEEIEKKEERKRAQYLNKNPLIEREINID
jgi:hypothetical protein